MLLVEQLMNLWGSMKNVSTIQWIRGLEISFILKGRRKMLLPFFFKLDLNITTCHLGESPLLKWTWRIGDSSSDAVVCRQTGSTSAGPPSCSRGCGRRIGEKRGSWMQRLWGSRGGWSRRSSSSIRTQLICFLWTDWRNSGLPSRGWASHPRPFIM